ncbi:hypothetical protein ACX27_15800 [Nostoc piscinale CENA21]|uniref:Uncharacterized protein n=1 Tax=Nostoc piscinale CENA21 TaxID=224013 RepID=A0A0M4TX86_9NOSO|nr:hypothetical protein ACX27_15800 [Nostoc piscinale CENA21]
MRREDAEGIRVQKSRRKLIKDKLLLTLDHELPLFWQLEDNRVSYKTKYETKSKVNQVQRI